MQLLCRTPATPTPYGRLPPTVRPNDLRRTAQDVHNTVDINPARGQATLRRTASAPQAAGLKPLHSRLLTNKNRENNAGCCAP
ncbi:MAG: hypothetical protein IJV22_00430 [Bacteroidales bacterium]|nr:hypothetical protein [Bacteroidales bacterium]